MAVTGDGCGRIERWEWLSLALIAAAFVAIRIPLFTPPGLSLGWNSDAALFGLMARAMRNGVDFPVYFWGQTYLGTLTSMITAAVGWISGAIGPRELRIAASIEVATAFIFFWLALRRAFGRVAMLALLWLAAGPSFLFFFTIAPIGAEELFFASALLFWYATRAQLTRPSEWLVLGILAGFGTWLHQGVVFLCVAIAVAAFAERLVRLRFVLVFAAGFVAGWMPAMIALLRGDPVLYRRTLLDWSVREVLSNIFETFRGDLWLLLADATVVGVATAACIIALAVAGLRGHPPTRTRIIIIVTIVTSAAFWLFSTYGYPGAVRYVTPLVPLVYGAAALGLTRLFHRNRGAAIATALAITLALFVPRAWQTLDVAAGRSERYTDWPGHFDPRPTEAALRTGGYSVCYGEVWVAHKLEWISSPTVRFVSVRSVHRTLAESLSLIQRPGRKCFVDNDGNVRTLSTSEEQYWRASVITRARKAGIEGPRS